MNTLTPTLLIIEDDDLQYEIYEEALSKFKLVRVKTGSEGLAQLPTLRPDALILDHVLDKGQLGLDFLPEFRELLPFVPIIVVSGALEVHEQLQALQGPRRAHYCLTKPVDIRALKRTVEIALKECGEKEVVRQFEALERSHRSDALDLFSRSSDRLSRQNQIRDVLGKSRERPNISALARQFGVARRTIIRDLQDLIRRGQLKPEVYPEWENPPEEEA
ncbi:MAG TPA: response regulator transcription factor [Candidatus Binatia bacterium]|jgi:DNA-binding NtrC family response regulator|nr:response regulator transcription factor [Candidatus Binatia bacterium]